MKIERSINMNQMTCYFSYSWGSDAEDEVLARIKEQIEALSNYKIDVIYDKKDFRTGDNIIEREEQIKKSDSIVLFFTPSYKDKVIMRDDSKGAYREYRIIKERLQRGDDNIIPILLSGTAEKSVTAEFVNIIYDDLSIDRSKYVIKGNKIVLSSELDKSIKKIAKQAIVKTEMYAWLREHSFDSLEDEYRALFLDTSPNAGKPLPNKCMIKTDVYDAVINQDAYFIIGRKGSGKTTLLDAIKHYDSKLYYNNYKMTNSVNAESINLELIYRELILHNRPDLYAINIAKICRTFWEVFMFLQCVFNIGVELERFRINENDDRKRVFERAVNKLKTKLGTKDRNLDDGMSNDSLFTCATELLMNYLSNDIFKNANSDTLITSVFNNLTSTAILEALFGKKLFLDFRRAIKRCKRKMLIAIDGFDPHSEDFRRNTNLIKNHNPEEYKLRKEFEVLFYRELMITISNIKSNHCSDSFKDIFSIVHFCIIIPQDRYDEIKLVDRDIAKKNYTCLSWDAYDLLLMLVKRLEYYFKISEQDNSDLLQRFNHILKTNLPQIPTDVKITIDGYSYTMPLFNYILRLSFWRPRDIIKNFAVIMKLSKESSMIKDSDVMEDIVKNLLANSAKNIIEQEFVNEYRNVYTNLESVLHRFETLNLVNSYHSIMELLSKIEIKALSDSAIQQTDEKLLLLYKLGVIGLFYEKKDAEKYGYNYHICFVFNEGLQPIEDLQKHIVGDNYKVQLIFNPIFSKYLMMNFNTKELVGNFDFNYIRTNHIIKDTIRRI